MFKQRDPDIATCNHILKCKKSLHATLYRWTLPTSSVFNRQQQEALIISLKQNISSCNDSLKWPEKFTYFT